MSRFAFFPAVETEDDLIDLVSRAAWFLTCTTAERITIPIADPSLARSAWRVAPGMDPAIAERFAALRELVEMVYVRSEADLIATLEPATIVFSRRESARVGESGSAAVRSLLAGKKVLRVDADAVRQEGSFYIEASFWEIRGDRDLIAASAERFKRLKARLGERERAYVLATGPSVGDYAKFDYTDSVGVVCNSVILNHELMRTVQPQVVTFADPIFHFGPSQYAASFRESLRRAAAEFDFEICLPLKYHRVFTAAMPEMAERTIALPFDKEREFNFDLAADFELRTTANILTFVMLPIAASLARDIRILGCDGRPLSENTYFWSHNRSTQINDRMANIREVHPGFFDIDYNDYYSEHCELLAEQLDAAEAVGRDITCLGFSHIPALAERMPMSFVGSTNGGAPTPVPAPRLLVIDSTETPGRSATGRVRQSLLRDWPQTSLLQVFAPEHDRFPVVGPSNGDRREPVAAPWPETLSRAQVIERVANFDPEVVYYRPTIDRHLELNDLTRELLDRHSPALVTHLIDDRSSRRLIDDPTLSRRADAALRETLGRSSHALSASESMSQELGARYGVEFEVVTNGIESDKFAEAIELAGDARDRREEIVLRYCGAVAPDKTFEALVDVARAVDTLSGEIPVHFEVNTMETWQPRFQAAVGGLRGVNVSGIVSDAEYPLVLAESDILVLGYSFEESAQRHLRVSMPDKLPEYLASGAAVLAYGPREQPGIQYVLSNDLGTCVTERDQGKLVGAVARLANDRSLRNKLGQRSQAWAFDRLDIIPVMERFQAILREAADERSPSAAPLAASGKPGPVAGPYSRSAGAGVDESDVIADMLSAKGRDNVMIDVGAHHGSSMARFAGRDWTVVACEPDPANRARLTQRFDGRDNVTIDPRAVSEEPARGVEFFSSDESTGISALHAFRESHETSATVDVTTVAELVDAHGLAKVDFLKIDVEGFDLSVLKGVPWDKVRPRVVTCEFEDAKTERLGHTYEAVVDYLESHDYTVFLSEWHPIVRYGIAHQWRQLLRSPAELGTRAGWGNVVAFRDDPGDEALAAAFEKRISVERPGARDRPAGSRNGASPSAASVASNGAGTVDPPTIPKPGPIPPEAPPAPPRATPDAPFDPVLPPDASRYERLYVQVRKRSAKLFAAGQVAMWTLRKLRAHPIVGLLFVVLAASAVVGALAVGGTAGVVLWGAVGALAGVAILIIGAGYLRYMIKRAVFESQLQHNASKRRLDRTIARQSAIYGELRNAQKATGALADGLGRLGRHTDASLEQLDERTRAMGAELDASSNELKWELASLSSVQRSIRSTMTSRLSELERGQALARRESNRIEAHADTVRAELSASISSERAARQHLAKSFEAFGAREGAARAELVASIEELGLSERAAREELAGSLAALEATERAARAELSDSIAELGERERAARGELAESLAALQATERAARAELDELRRTERAERSELAALVESKAESEQAAREDLAAALAALQATEQAAHEDLSASIAEIGQTGRAERGKLAGRLTKLGREHSSHREETANRLEALREGQLDARRGIGRLSRERIASQRAIDDALSGFESARAEAWKAIEETVGSIVRDVSRLEGLRDAVVELERELAASNERSEAERVGTAARLSGLEGALSDVIEEPSDIERVSRLRHPSVASSAWRSLSPGSSAELARLGLGTRVRARLAGSTGLQLLAQPTVLAAASDAAGSEVGVSSLLELPLTSRHEVRWRLSTSAGDGETTRIAVLAALRSQGRGLVELSLESDDEILVRARFDIEATQIIGGAGLANGRGAVQTTPEGWRACCLSLPVSDVPEDAVFRLSIAESAEFAPEYAGVTGCGVIACDPIVLAI